jgi:hypothetical protein
MKRALKDNIYVCLYVPGALIWEGGVVGQIVGHDGLGGLFISVCIYVLVYVLVY